MRWVSRPIALFALVLGSFAPTAVEAPELTVISPKDGAVIEADVVTVEFEVGGITLVPTKVPVSEAGKHPEANRSGEGHLHFMLDLQPLVVWDSAEPYQFVDVPPGEHQLMVELVNNDHSPFSPPVIQNVRFRVGGMQVLPSAGAAQDDSTKLSLLILAVFLAAIGLILRRVRRWAE